ncbi:isoprenoid synthase domain-containing protein [Pelagophyceae sp. CCMP2097]|nr:isoprenoid synthase domain-containing protein [Pelagophyceae sp. CCMP2097]
MEWSADGCSQDDLMLKDEVLVVDFNDQVVGHDNKYNAHKFVLGQPTGIVHRAFSVMLFDSQGRILLQQRASDKITFPDVWTNTCCSHPLYGMAASEVDGPESTNAGTPMGVKRAAVRKLQHELGIPAGALKAERFAYKTRVHYWASDSSHGAESPWGEHEIDYLLLLQLQPGEELKLQPHPEEVRAIKWLGKADLKKAISEKTDMPLWSPWFEIIANKFLFPSGGYWGDLPKACDPAQSFGCDFEKIHRFDCCAPDAAPAGAGGALPFLGALALAEEGKSLSERRVVALAAQRRQMLVDIATTTARVATGDKNKKQGAYGKVATHKVPMAEGLTEFFKALRFKVAPGLTDNMAVSSDADERFCDEMLGKVSRSFASVIRQLPPGLCVDICVFYLVLRALDTVEDDMDAYKGRQGDKVSELRGFASTRLYEKDCSITGVGEGDEKTLIENFGAVVRVFLAMPPASRAVIQSVTQDMGDGMADYISADLVQGTKDVAAYNLYCHAVAGLVGEGLTRIFVARGYETANLEGQGALQWPFAPHSLGLANSMGLFLQKTNIIRDYLEDYVDGRAFWPRDIWTKHAITGDLGEFARPTARVSDQSAGVFVPPAVAAVIAKGGSGRALALLDELVADALELVPDALEYLRRIQTPEVYRFCAIPQVMAIATLAQCFGNPKLFTGVVKIRKGTAASLIVDSQHGHAATLEAFAKFAHDIKTKAKGDSALRQLVRQRCDTILTLTAPAATAKQARFHRHAAVLAAAAAAVAVYKYRR